MDGSRKEQGWHVRNRGSSMIKFKSITATFTVCRQFHTSATVKHTTVRHCINTADMPLPRDVQEFLSGYTRLKDDMSTSENWEFYAEVPVGRNKTPRRCVPDGLTITQLHKG